MLPAIRLDSNLTPNYRDYLEALKKASFSGEIHTDFATRLAVATDNSIYQVIPQAVLFPRSTDDIAIVLALAHDEKFKHEIKFCARGGGTSTNGQSLSAGIILDCSKYLNGILEYNLEEQWVRVQPGVVLDQLNTYLKKDGYCFAPEISPSNRATIGGMINTDASGIGSKVLGRTSAHVLDLTIVLANGDIITSIDAGYHDKVVKLLKNHQQTIEEKFTDAPRTLSGYQLKKAFYHLNYLFCGSEGTLGVITECRLKLTRIPQYKKVIIIKYQTFDDALRDRHLQSFTPLAIEAIDEKLIALARQDSFYFYIKHFIDDAVQAGAINIVEFVGENEECLEKQVAKCCEFIENNKNIPHHAIGYYIAKNIREEKLIWDLRKKSVGLISQEKDGSRRPIPFIEDTAVPPHYLADYIQAFKQLLDKCGLHYGMYGHVDAGCVHVRPALDLKNIQDEKLLRELSEQVIALLEKYQGVLWGEHGQGYRSEFGERFFGKELYYLIREIKTLFDPYDQLNPGKIATSLDGSQSLVTISSPLRGQFDKKIDAHFSAEFSSALICNGNGVCFNYASSDVMCPSYKATQDRIHSPKGRATLMRIWLYQLSQLKHPLNVYLKTSLIKKIWNTLRKQKDFNDEVLEAVSGCLGCKGCVSQCPLSVDVPDFKAKFLASYYQRYVRHPRDYLIGFVEYLVPIQAKFRRLNNYFMQKSWARKIFRRMFKLIDLPLLANRNAMQLLKSSVLTDAQALKQLTKDQKSKTVIIVQDMFTTFYEPDILFACQHVLQKLGLTVYIAPYFPNGKPLHVKGFINVFKKRVIKNANYLQQLASLEIPLIGIDPSVTLTYRDEYAKFHSTQFHVYLLQEWLAKNIHSMVRSSQNFSQSSPTILHSRKSSTVSYFLLSHCTEKTSIIAAENQWQDIFSAFGSALQPLSAGCCGMAGSYGHEVEHVKISKDLFSMDWNHHLTQNNEILATGASCRSQALRLKGIKLKHPIQAIAELLT